MKKILFLQIKNNSMGGIWFVNSILGNEFINLGYHVEMASIRKNPGKMMVDETKFKVTCMNEKKLWEIIRLSDLKNDLKKFKLISFTKKFILKIRDEILLKRDYLKMKKFINNFKPDVIITTHYQLLDAIPKKYLKNTIHEQHTSLKITKTNKANMKTFNKYKNKIRFVWLAEKTCEEAINLGYKKSTCIYNPIRLNIKEPAKVLKNKKIVTVSRISYEKSIDEMIDIVNEIFKDKKYSDWKFEIYGNGPLKAELEKKVKNQEQIKFMGFIKNTQNAFIDASINLCTSLFEGMPMSILEANECGVPTISYEYGETIYELIDHEKTGIIIKNRDKQEFIKQLKELMSNEEKLKQYSFNCKKNNEKFNLDKIVNKWISLFNEVSGENE